MDVLGTVGFISTRFRTVYTVDGRHVGPPYAAYSRNYSTLGSQIEENVFRPSQRPIVSVQLCSALLPFIQISNFQFLAGMQQESQLRQLGVLLILLLLLLLLLLAAPPCLGTTFYLKSKYTFPEEAANSSSSGNAGNAART